MQEGWEKVALFIDGANLHATARALGFEIDYRQLLRAFVGQGTLLRALYYTTIVEDDQQFSPLRPLIDWLDYNGYSLVTKPAKEFIDAGGHRKVKGSMGVELAIDALELADYIDRMVLFSGDGDFCALVAAMQSRQCETVHSRPA